GPRGDEPSSHRGAGPTGAGVSPASRIRTWPRCVAPPMDPPSDVRPEYVTCVASCPSARADGFGIDGDAHEKLIGLSPLRRSGYVSATSNGSRATSLRGGCDERCKCATDLVGLRTDDGAGPLLARDDERTRPAGASVRRLHLTRFPPAQRLDPH